MSSPARPTVESVSAPYANVLCPLPPVVDGVCSICRSHANPGYDRCFRCGREALVVGPETADAVAFVALAPAIGGQSQFARELYAYKDHGVDVQLCTRLGAVLWRWLGRHEACLARACGAGGFDVITTVPSSSSDRDGEHPLVRVVSRIVVDADTRYEPLLATGSIPVERRVFSAERFVAEDCSGLRILLIDDTWASGSHLLGAARALKLAGADAVGGLALGRWYYPTTRTTWPSSGHGEAAAGRGMRACSARGRDPAGSSSALVPVSTRELTRGSRWRPARQGRSASGVWGACPTAGPSGRPPRTTSTT